MGGGLEFKGINKKNLKEKWDIPNARMKTGFVSIRE